MYKNAFEFFKLTFIKTASRRKLANNDKMVNVKKELAPMSLSSVEIVELLLLCPEGRAEPSGMPPIRGLPLSGILSFNIIPPCGGILPFGDIPGGAPLGDIPGGAPLGGMPSGAPLGGPLPNGGGLPFGGGPPGLPFGGGPPRLPFGGDGRSI